MKGNIYEPWKGVQKFLSPSNNHLCVFCLLFLIFKYNFDVCQIKLPTWPIYALKVKCYNYL